MGVICSPQPPRILWERFLFLRTLRVPFLLDFLEVFLPKDLEKGFKNEKIFLKDLI
jgi:hypothetical protein